LEVANIPVPKEIDGLSFLPDLTKSGNQKQHEYLYWEFHEQGGKQAVRWKEWKAVRLKVGSDANAPIELYNLSNDSKERNNVASKFPGIVKRMEGYIREAHIINPEWPLLLAEKF
jgi:hypothetical protein